MAMNKILKGLSIFYLIVIVGCSQDVISIPEKQLQDGEDVTVSFTTSVPEYKTVITRANGGVNEMYLLVFDENGNYIARRVATLSSQTSTGGTFTAQLPSSNNPRIIHFVSNYDWTNFNDTPGINEVGVVALLSSQNATFWSRMVLNSGISSTSFNGITVELLRNQAKISVINEAAELTYNGFTIHNTPQKGTVAPYSFVNGFTIGTITEPLDISLSPALVSGISTDEKFLFERKNATASNITTVIVRGTYSGQQYYYKIDLIDAQKNRYNIERNYHYIVKIKKVTRAGYASFNDALQGASHNNTALDPIIEKYPIISDGTSKLEVERTLVVLTQPNQQLNVWAKYFPDINSETFNNSGVTVAIQSGNESLVGSSLSFAPSTGIITATGLNQLPQVPGEARIIVSQGELARTIRVVLRIPFVFDPVTINNSSPATLNGAQGENAVLRFNIPNDFPDDLFPLPINIYTQGLYPAATGLEMIVESGQIHYIYRATQKGLQTVNFKTNKSGNLETVTLKADYFTDGAVGYNVVIKTGNLTYGSASTPVPYAWRSGLSATAGTFYMPINENGKYVWSLSSTQASQSQTVSLEVVEGLLRKRYSRSSIIPNSTTNINLNTETVLSVEGGTITYGGANVSVPAGTGVPSGATVTASTGSITITATGQFLYNLPATYNSSTPVTFTYNKQVNTNYSEQYSMITTIGNLITSGAITMSPVNFIFEGTIQYRSGQWSNVPSDGNVSVVSPSPGSIIMTATGAYQYTVSSATSDSQSITFRYRRNNTNYNQTKTITQLKADASLRLQQ